VIFRENKQSATIKMMKIFFTVLILGLFIIQPCFIPAQALDTEKDMTVEVLELKIRETQIQLNSAKLLMLEMIKQGILDIKEKIIILGQEVQKIIDLFIYGNLGKETEMTKEQEEVKQATSTEETIQATSTEETISENTTSTDVVEEVDDGEASSSTEIGFVGGGGGGGDNDEDSVADEMAPADITSLRASNPTVTSIDISWIAPGDDGASSGLATAYDIRYSTVSINSGNWNLATQVSNEPSPLKLGSLQRMKISGLSFGTTYYVAMKTSDEVPNISELSNVVNLETRPPGECAIAIAAGPRTYFTRTNNNPQIMKIDVSELNVQFGASQNVTAMIRDTDQNPIHTVSGRVQTDAGFNDFSLSRISGNDTNGTWRGSWTLDDSICSIYEITITAISDSGSSVMALSFR